MKMNYGFPSKKRLQIFATRAWSLFFCIGLIICCSGTPDDNDPPPDDDNPVGEVDSTQIVDSTETYKPLVFTVIGDVPYNDAQRDGLITLIEAHNAKAESEFVMHVGDIKPGGDPCEESIYEDINGLLKEFDAPTFIILGDNEYNDCDDPEEALQFWNQYFLDFDSNWDNAPTVERQDGRPENFAWVQDRVLIIGLNIVGSSVHDEEEWQARLTDDADWIQEQLDTYSENIEATVVFGHANMVEVGPVKFEPFTERFRASAKEFGKPILFMQGDGHFYIEDRPWEEQNIVRVQIDGGANAIQVTVDVGLEEPFAFDRTFLD